MCSWEFCSKVFTLTFNFKARIVGSAGSLPHPGITWIIQVTRVRVRVIIVFLRQKCHPTVFQLSVKLEHAAHDIFHVACPTVLKMLPSLFLQVHGSSNPGSHTPKCSLLCMYKCKSFILYNTLCADNCDTASCASINKALLCYISINRPDFSWVWMIMNSHNNNKSNTFNNTEWYKIKFRINCIGHWYRYGYLANNWY